MTFPPGTSTRRTTRLGNGVQAAVYESLFYYNPRFEIEPMLATGWKQMSPTQVRVTLRQGVKFHDGAAFNADDVVFSLTRAMAKTSNFGVYTQGIDKVVKVDDYTVDIMTTGPNPVLIRQLTELRIMDKDWAEKHKSVEPKDIKTKDENHAHRHANGTGPFMLKSWEQDVRLVLERNPAWWGKIGRQRHRDRLHADQERSDARGVAAVGRGRFRARPVTRRRASGCARRRTSR